MLSARPFHTALIVLAAASFAGCGGSCPETTTTSTVSPSATAILTVGGEAAVLGEGPLSGVWDTTWSAGSAVMTLSQHGTHIAGWYTNPQPIAPGAVAATITGNVIEGRWTDHLSSGLLRLELGPDGRTFSGSWSNVDGSGGGAWTGVRR